LVLARVDGGSLRVGALLVLSVVSHLREGEDEREEMGESRRTREEVEKKVAEVTLKR
jgi:hypothetical protein